MGMSASQSRLLTLTARLSDLEFQAQQISNAKIRLSDASIDASRKYTEALNAQILTVYNGATTAYADATVSNMTSYTAAANLNGTNTKYRYMMNSSGQLIATPALLNSAGLAGGGTLKSQDQFFASCGVPKDANGQYDPNSESYKYYNSIYLMLANKKYEAISDENARSSDWLTQQVQFGNIFLYEYNSEGGTSGTGAFEGVSWTSGDTTLQMSKDTDEIAVAEAEYNTTMAEIQSKDKRFDLSLKEIDTEHQAVQTEIESVDKIIDKNIQKSFKIFDA